MKKLVYTLLATASLSAFAANNESAVAATNNQLDLNKLECHCEKHQMIFQLKDGESVTEMSKHCLINENKKQSAIKFLDDNSHETVKCDIKDGKLVIKSCKAFKHTEKAKYKHSSKMSASEYTTTSAHNN